METILDRSLRLRFGTRWIVNTMSLPRFLPRGVTVEKLDRGSAASGVFSFRLTTDDEDAYHVAVASLRASKSLFNSVVEERPGMLARIVNLPGSRSFDLAWLAVLSGPFLGLLLFL